MTEAVALGARVKPWVNINSAARRGQVLELLAAHLAGAACSAGFPELAHVPLLRLRHFAAATPVERFRSAARGLAAALEANVQFVAAARARAGFAPSDTSALQAFLAAEDAAQAVRVLTRFL